MRMGTGWYLSGEDEWVVVEPAGDRGGAFLDAAMASSNDGGG
jgi:hypothetical protein